MLCSASFERSRTLPRKDLSEYGTPTKVLGKGVYGKVERYEKGSERYAVKTFLSQDDRYTQSMIREITCMMRLEHPNVLPIIDVAFSGRKTSMVLPLANSDLNDIKGKGIPLLTKKKYAYQIIRGVAYCLSKDIYNRDIKPQNILLFDGELLRLADFGLARSTNCSYSSEITKMVYTLWYRPPEIFLGGNYGPPADIWAVGCVLYELFSDAVLFKGYDEMDMLYKIMRVLGNPTKVDWPALETLPNWPNIRSYVHSPYWDNVEAEVPRELADLLKAILQWDPTKRPLLANLLNLPFFDDVRDDIESRFPAPPLPIGFSCLEVLNQKECKHQVYRGDSKDRAKYLEKAMTFILKHLLSERTFFLYSYIFDSAEPFGEDEYYMACLAISNRFIDYSTVTDSDIEGELLDIKKVNEIIRYTLLSHNFHFITSTAYDYHTIYSSFYIPRVNNLAMALLIFLQKTEAYSKYLPSKIALGAFLVATAIERVTYRHSSQIDADVVAVTNEINLVIASDDPNLTEAFKAISGYEVRDIRPLLASLKFAVL